MHLGGPHLPLPWGAPAVFPARVTLPLLLFGSFPARCSHGAHALRGRPPTGPAILEGLSCRVWSRAFLPVKKGLWAPWGASCDFCPFPFSSAEPDRKGRVRGVLQDPSGKAANVAVLLRPPFFPVGVAAMFPEHKMATRGLYSSPTSRAESSRTRPPPVSPFPPVSRGLPRAASALTRLG